MHEHPNLFRSYNHLLSLCLQSMWNELLLPAYPDPVCGSPSQLRTIISVLSICPLYGMILEGSGLWLSCILKFRTYRCVYRILCDRDEPSPPAFPLGHTSDPHVAAHQLISRLVGPRASGIRPRTGSKE